MQKGFLSRLLYFLILGTIFLLPLFFVPSVNEIFNFNKQYLFYIVTLLGLLTWAARGVLEKKIDLVRTPLDIPLLVVLLVSLISSLVSLDRHISFWGDLNGLTYGFIPLVFYILFYFLALNTLTTAERIQKAIVAFAASSLVGMVYFFVRVSKIVPFPSNFPAFSPSSSMVGAFGLLLSVTTIFALGFLMVKNEASKSAYFWIPVLVASLIAETMLGFRTVWTGLVVGLILLLIFAISRLDDMRIGWVSATFAFMVIAILFAFLGTPHFLTASLPSEISLSPSVSWQITRDTLSDNFKNFLFGSGPATFLNDFSRARPAEFNNNFAWNVRFLKPYSNIFEILATTGILGLIAMIVVLLAAAGSVFLSWFRMASRAPKREKGLVDAVREVVNRGGAATQQNFSIFAVWLLLVVHLFITSFETVHWVLFYLCLALIFTASFEASGARVQKISLKTSPHYALVSSFVTILIFTAVVVLGVYLGRFYAADLYSVSARNSGNPDQSIAGYTAAVNLNPGRYQYHLGLASAYISRASEELGKASADPNLIRELVARSVNEARLATDRSPKNVAAWEFLSNMYANARALTNDATRFQISALEKAIELEPTNPALLANLGSVKLAVGNVAEARDKYKEAIKLKSDFIPGYTALALLEEQTGNATQAIEYMATAAQIAPTDPGTVFNLARLYYNRSQGDDVSRAEQLLLYVIQLNPNYSDALFSLGLLNERRGNAGEAVKYYQRVQVLNPGNADVRAKIQALLAPAPVETGKVKKRR